jgi:hypothetical protein
MRESSTTAKSVTEQRSPRTSVAACFCESGVKFATANPSFGGPPHSKARCARKNRIVVVS